MVTATYRCCAASCPCSSRHSEEGDEPPGLEHSASFEWRPQGHGELCLLQPAYSAVRDAEVEAIYEELEDPYTIPEEAVSLEDGVNGDGWTGYVEDMTRESEDEGVWVEGDAGFTWEDPRMEQWRWEVEQGIWEDVSEEECEERGHEEDEDKDEEEEEEIWE